MEVIIITELYNGISVVTATYIIPNENQRDNIVKKAESLFLDILSSYTNSETEKENSLEKGYYERNGYEVKLEWSTPVNAVEIGSFLKTNT